MVSLLVVIFTALVVLADVKLFEFRNTDDRIEDHGYPAEGHFVTTDDHYELEIFRIPYSPKLNNAAERKPVVLLQHGMLGNSDFFLLNGPDNALTFNLADAGYDVWLGNARGNTYGRPHTKSSEDFWKFSWHEIGYYDMPAIIDFILRKTGQTQLHYVGHSQGTTVFFVMASTRPEYNQRIKTAHMLAPAVFMGNSTQPVITLITGLESLSPKLKNVFPVVENLARNQEFPNNAELVQEIINIKCQWIPSACINLYMATDRESNINQTLIPLLFETHPSSISTNQALHYLQSHRTNDFRYFDYGKEENLQKYRVQIPPAYDLTKIAVPMYIYYGTEDVTTVTKDVERLPDSLPNSKVSMLEVPRYHHLDLVLAEDVKERINDVIIRNCNEYENAN